MKKGLFLIVVIGLVIIIASLGSSVIHERIRSAGVLGFGIDIVLLDADTLSTGYIRIDDTTYSDTLDLDTLAQYMNIFIHLYAYDTGSILTTDTARDTIVVRTMTSFGYGRPSYALFTDTFVNVPDSVWHKYFLDTAALTHFYFQTIIWDSIDEGITPSTNSYKMSMDILAGGNR